MSVLFKMGEVPSFETLLFRLFLVILVGGLIGGEREYHNKSAGFRTMILICLGSFLFTTFSIYITDNSPDRIASNIVTGIGFLGAGVIFKSDNRVNGLTTAATIWATASLGMGIAAGQYLLVGAATSIIFASLILFTKLEKWLDRLNQTRSYTIVCANRPEQFLGFENFLKECGLTFRRVRRSKNGEYISCTWMVHGKDKHHNCFIEQVLQDNTVREFRF